MISGNHMKTSTVVGVLAAVVIVGGLAWWVYAQQGMAPVAQETATTTPNTTTGSETGGNAQTGTNAGVNVGVTVGAQTYQVTYDGTSFSPKDITIKVGDTVTWTNTSSGNMWVASAVHPTHSVYSGTTLNEHCAGGPSSIAFDQCEGGSSYTFTFTKAGTHRYHDHISASKTGSVTVTQ
jgi:plastocyanin